MNRFMKPFVFRKTTALGPLFSADFCLKCQRNHVIMSDNDIGGAIT